jgi:NADP-reducing hydrogenase subunit HndB
MPKIGSLDELRKLRESAQHDLAIRRNTGTKITVGMGTCGIAAGARDTLQSVIKELDARDIEANVATVGCIGMCSKEPLVDIEQAGKPRVTYANVHPDMVPRLIEEHLVNGHVIQEWVFGRVSEGGVAVPDRTVS